MTKSNRIFVWRGPTLALQIMGLLLGGLIVAQAVTLMLTLLLPPDPPARYGLDDIAVALRAPAAKGPSDSTKGLQRKFLTHAPVISGRGWLQAPASRISLAKMLGVPSDRVVLAFYTPLPFAGTVASSPRPGVAFTGPISRAFLTPVDKSALAGRPSADPELQAAVLIVGAGSPSPASLLTLAQAGPGPGGAGGPPIGIPGGGFPGSFPGAGFPSNPPGAATGTLPAAQPALSPPTSTNNPSQQAPAVSTPLALPQVSAPAPAPAPIALPPQVITQVPPAIAPASPEPSSAATASQSIALRSEREAPVSPVPAMTAGPIDSEKTPAPNAAGTEPTTNADDRTMLPDRTGLAGAIDRARSLLGLAPVPYVEGDFIAAVALDDGRWAVVAPRPDGWLSPWQLRIMLWFVLAFGLTAPFGWLFARRLSRPLDRFADAAARLGRDPSLAIAALDGPAEIGRAAHAFNLMQQRLRSFVDDRTAMVGAISHDLRTPLTRMRFRIEDAPEILRDAMLAEVDEMEQMITSVLAFIRDASTPGARERVDLRTLLQDVVEDAAVIGADIKVQAESAAPVEVDVLGMRRVLANLVENALKYGAHARINLSVLQNEAVAAVIDDGPGLAEDELERVFEPFYRTSAACASGAPGTGLGLAVCRSIARAHGGDVRLFRSVDGFHAEVRVPLAYDATTALAA